MNIHKLPAQNQLQFNLGIPPVTTNLAVKFHHPKPIVVEKAGASIRPPAFHNVSCASSSALQFTSLSEDKLDRAVKLAQRDLKKKKNEENFQELSVKNSLKEDPPTTKKTGQTKIVQSHQYRERLKEQSGREKKKNLPVRERGVNRAPRQIQTQTGSRSTGSPVRRAVDSNLPVTTNSPPTRDTDAYPSRKWTNEPRLEIERLQKEMEQYLQQIQVIEQRAVQDQNMEALSHVKRRNRTDYLQEEEDPIRRAIRVEEQATRSARQIYFLRQQLREIQNEVIRVGPQKIRQTKKSQTMSRLAAAHRGALRCIQNFVHQLPQQDLQQGLPTNYHELALVVRQLSLLSSELTGDMATQEDLLKMLTRVDELNHAWCSELQLRYEQKRAQQVPVRAPVPVQRATQPKSAQNKLRGKENKPKDVQVTPERQEALRAGLAALMRESTGLTAGEAWAVDDSMGMGIEVNHPTHFADPTLASNMKAVTEQRNLITEETVSPRRNRSHSRHRSRSPWRPSGSLHRSPERSHARSQSPTSSRRFLVQDVEEDVVKELFPNQKQNKQGEHRGRSKLRSPSANRSFSGPDRLVRDAEQKIKQRLQPLLSKAESVAARQERLCQASNHSLRATLAERALNDIGVNEEAVSDMILQDILRDTASELQRLEGETTAHKHALSCQDNPTLEGIFQQLEYMEQEQLDIRRRWVTAQYEEPDLVPQWKSDHGPQIEDRPAAPSAIKISRKMEDRNQKKHFFKSSNVPQGGNSPIVFTRVKPSSCWVEEKMPILDDYDSHSHSHYAAHRTPKTTLTLSEDMVTAIHEQKEKFERHLKKSSHHIQGKFNPWKLVEEISDQVLKECIHDIATELEDVNDAIVNHVCKSEFMVAKSTDISTDNQVAVTIEPEDNVTETEEQTDSESLQLHSEDESDDVAL
ncbi:hypothetical protein ScPMuIL_006723 [Solemya velum]